MEQWRFIDPESRVLITGANGFIGTRVVHMALEYGLRNLRCLVRPTSRLDGLLEIIKQHGVANTIEIVRGDLTSRSDCDAAATGVQVVLHLAAGFDQSIEVVSRNSVTATRNVIEACMSAGALRRFVLVSSFAVYSNMTLPRQAMLDEHSPLKTAAEQSHDAYAYGKLRQEELVREYGRSRGMPYVVLRPGAVFGPGKRELTGRIGFPLSKVFFLAGGDNVLPATYVDNCAEAIVLASLQPGVQGETFNVVDDDLPTCRQFLQEYRARVDEMFVVPCPYWAAYSLCGLLELVSRLLPGTFRFPTRVRARAEWKGNRFTNAHLRSRLGWSPRVPMNVGMERFFGQF